MSLLQIILIVGVFFLILEIFTPTLFFLNFSISAFLTAVCSLYIFNLNILIGIFVALSIVLLLFVRPVILKYSKKTEPTGIENKYIGRQAKVIEKITTTSGVVSIYDERWEARIESGEDIAENELVKIIRTESLILYVEKI